MSALEELKALHSEFRCGDFMGREGYESHCLLCHAIDLAERAIAEARQPSVTREEAITAMLEQPPGTIQDCDFGRQMRERAQASAMLANLESLGVVRFAEEEKP